MVHTKNKTQFSKLIAVFPGQGSQVVGMGRDLYQNFSIAKQVFEEASDAIRINIKTLCFEGPMEQLTLTENTQPCLLTSSIAAFRVAQQEYDFIPGAAAGHSLGEYSALVATGSLDLTTAVQWVRERGRAMQEAVPPGTGGMAAILGLEDSAISTLCAAATDAANTTAQEKAETEGKKHTQLEVVEPANFNAPGQIVIAGSTLGIQTAISLVQNDARWKGGKAIALQVSAPFHCRLMQPARNRMADVFKEAHQRPLTPLFPYVPNRTGRLNAEAGIISELLIEQIDHPVLWNQSVSTLLENGFHSAIEFGPGKVLCGLIKRIAPKANPCQLTSVSDSESIKTLQAFLATANAPKQENTHV